MSALGGRLDGLTVLDLFAGSGALGLEALSRGAEHATFVERARASMTALEANIRLLDAGSSTTVVKAEAHAWLARRSGADFDLALADPPYGEGHASRLVDRWIEAPFARELWVEHRTAEPLPEVEGLRQRRYGDTTLSTLSRAPDA